MLFRNSTTVRQNSIRPLLTLAAILGFRIWWIDVNTPTCSPQFDYFATFLTPGKEFEFPTTHLLKVLRPCYGLTDSSDYWNETFEQYIKNDLKMCSTAQDISFFFKKACQKLKGLIGTYVDIALFAGHQEFLKHSEKTKQGFESKDHELEIK